MGFNQVLSYRDNNPAFRLVVLYATVFLGSAGFFITLPAYAELFLGGSRLFFPALTSMAERRSLYGLIISVAPLLSMLFAPVMASLSDRLGRKRLMLICLMIMAVGFVLPLFALITGSLLLLFLGHFINSLGSTVQPIAQAELGHDTPINVKAFRMSCVGIVMTAAMSIGPAVGSKLIALYGAGAPFYTCLIMALVNLAALFSLNVNSTEKTSILVDKKRFSLLAPFSRSQIILFPTLCLIFICQFCWSLYFASIVYILPGKWGIAVSSSFYQGFMLSIGVVMILSLVFLPKLCLSRFSLLTCLRTSLLIGALGMLMLMLSPSPSLHVIAMIPTAMALAILYPFYITLLSAVVAKEDQGWGMALATVAIGVAWTLSGYLSAVLANIALWVPLAVATVGLVLASGLVWGFIRRGDYKF